MNFSFHHRSNLNVACKVDGCDGQMPIRVLETPDSCAQKLDAVCQKWKRCYCATSSHTKSRRWSESPVPLGRIRDLNVSQRHYYNLHFTEHTIFFSWDRISCTSRLAFNSLCSQGCHGLLIFLPLHHQRSLEVWETLPSWLLCPRSVSTCLLSLSFCLSVYLPFSVLLFSFFW